jgi:hypothetical protein
MDRKALVPALDEYYRSVARHIEVRQAADLREASGFNVFSYVRRDESSLSDVIRDLLDPSGTHGQGRLFLDLFLKSIGVPPESVHPPFRVKRERLALARRLAWMNASGRFEVCVRTKSAPRDVCLLLMFAPGFYSSWVSRPALLSSARLPLLRLTSTYHGCPRSSPFPDFGFSGSMSSWAAESGSATIVPVLYSCTRLSVRVMRGPGISPLNKVGAMISGATRTTILKIRKDAGRKHNDRRKVSRRFEIQSRMNAIAILSIHKVRAYATET